MDTLLDILLDGILFPIWKFVLAILAIFVDFWWIFLIAIIAVFI